MRKITVTASLYCCLVRLKTHSSRRAGHCCSALLSYCAAQASFSCIVFDRLMGRPFYDHLAWLKHHTALDTIPEFNWLPVGNHALDSSTNWYSVGAGKPAPKHYNSLEDPLHIPNLQNDILEPVCEALHNRDVKIKHVILLKLESTQQDVERGKPCRIFLLEGP